MNQEQKLYLQMLKQYKKQANRWTWFVPTQLKKHGLCSFISENYAGTGLQRFLNQRFYVTGRRSLAFPFGTTNYNFREYNKTQHKCPIRRAWVDEEIERFEKQLSRFLE